MKFSGEDNAAIEAIDFVSTDCEEETQNTAATRVEPPSSSQSHTYPINGINVRFPFVPYPCQLGMMDRIIRSLNGVGQHALLESPTGSGKTLSLLCAVLAWVEEQKKKNPALERGLFALAEDSQCDRVSGSDDGALEGSPPPLNPDDTMDRDFIAFEDLKPEATPKSCDSCPSKAKALGADASVSLPKIYFTSRTHKQLAQVIRELKRSGYTSKFTVLASRSHYCVNTAVREAKDVNEACREALAPKPPAGRCMYANRLPKFIGRNAPFSTNMDVEELVDYGKTHQLCPYFLARSGAESAEIIMCPYNYIVDPVIRAAMQIELENAIIIVDEAHNIEDVARAAGSFEVTQETIQLIKQELNGLLMTQDPGFVLAQASAHQNMMHVVSVVMNWMNKQADLGPASANGTSHKSFESNTEIFEGQRLVSELLNLGFTEKSVRSWQLELDLIDSAAAEILNERMQNPKEIRHCLSPGFLRVLSGLFFALLNVLSDSGLNLAAFRLVRYETIKFDTRNIRRAEVTMGFWCLSPEVVFREISAKAKAIVLTSGTLSPMDTFASELQTDFPLQLEAQHVITPSQVFVATLPRGPNGQDLLGNFQNCNSWAYQDDIAQSIYKICHVTPFGVLCFLPSYALLDKILDRMKATGVYASLALCKEIITEPRAGSTEEFEKLIKRYYRVIAECKKSLKGLSTGNGRKKAVSGAIFFAVYRGKVSEGLDFADEHARAVINIGIPYPAFKDQKVMLKKEYNDRHMRAQNLLSGNAWYETQAFRALNQATGRCIRHRNDWGAIIFLESRFVQQRNIQKLSKWVRPSVKDYKTFDEGLDRLREFMKSKGSILPEEVLNASNADYNNPLGPTIEAEELVDFEYENGHMLDWSRSGNQYLANDASKVSSFFNKRLGPRQKRPRFEE